MGAAWYAFKDHFGFGLKEAADGNVHLAAAADWLARAQDATPDDGVSAWYDIRESAWKASYPETSGYIIPTFYDYARYSGRSEFRERAERIADWELEIQLPEGGVRAGTIDSDVVAPTIFNTGQVLLGWLRAFQETRAPRFRDAAVRAADWLVAAQDADGAWRRFASPFATHELNSYNTRVAYALASAGALLQEQRYSDAARANVQWAMSQAHPNTWLDNNDLVHNDRPLTHTVAYALRGILEVGKFLHEEKFLDFACRMGRAVANAQRRDGALPGCLDRQWRPAARWSCLTGNAQMAINWLHLADLTGDATFKSNASRANHFNMRVHDINSGCPDLRGGVKGSFPMNGGYMTYRCPNWAAKFFMDALLAEQGRVLDETAPDIARPEEK